MIDIMTQVACNVTNANNIHDQNETVKNMTNITNQVGCNVENAYNIYNRNEIIHPLQRNLSYYTISHLGLFNYTGTVGEGQLSQHMRRSLGDITSMSSSAILISVDSLFLVGYKDNCILRGIYGFPKHPWVIHMVDWLSLKYLPVIPSVE